jgi:16S rRNA (cytosine967-C5)-methyltransferase
VVRKIAVQILGDVHRSRHLFAADCIHAASREHRLGKRDRRFLTELVFGVLRHQTTLDCILAKFSRRPLERINAAALEALRLGVFQMLYLDGVPTFAAIHESVSALSAPTSVRAFVNGILRTIDREVRRVPPEQDRGGASPRKRLAIGDRKVCFFPREVFADPEQDPARYLTQLYSHNEFLVTRWLERFGRERSEGILQQQNQPPRLTVRTNRRRLDRAELLDRLAHDEVRCREGDLADAVVVLAPPTELVRSATFRAGLCTVQDETAMKVAPALGAEPGERILDLCAAPGGKSTHLAEITRDEAQIFAVDRDPRRLRKLEESVLRLDLGSIQPIAFDPLENDDVPEPLKQPFDRVLVDAPCSNSGVLGRRPEARYRFGEDRLGNLAAVQGKLLAWARDRVRPGGTLVYSTCSLEEEENRCQVDALLTAHPDLHLVRDELSVPTHGSADGGYHAVLVKGSTGRP